MLGSHPASNPEDIIGTFPWGEMRFREIDYYFHLVPILRISGVKPPLLRITT
jgi:hypothetical protein